MASSIARIEANRRNAQKSTGPKTAEGKARSRANSLKHGLAGAGMVIPADDLARVAEMERNLVAEIGPRTEVAASLVHRYAVLHVRLERCERHDAAATARRVRTAIMDRDNQRWDEVAAHGRRLADEPADAVRRLKQTPEGLEWLIERWLDFRAELAGGPVDDPAALAERAGSMLGLSPARARVSDWGAWCRALEGDPSGLPDEPNRWALDRVDREVAALHDLLAQVDREAEAADRAEAGARALLDFGPEGERARRYEAAAHRDLFRVLRELKRAQEEAQDEPNPAPAPAPPPPLPAPMPPPAPALRSILDDLPAPARALAPGFGGFLDIAATPAAPARADRRAARPRLR